MGKMGPGTGRGPTLVASLPSRASYSLGALDQTYIYRWQTSPTTSASASRPIHAFLQVVSVLLLGKLPHPLAKSCYVLSSAPYRLPTLTSTLSSAAAQWSTQSRTGAPAASLALHLLPPCQARTSKGRFKSLSAPAAVACPMVSQKPCHLTASSPAVFAQ